MENGFDRSSIRGRRTAGELLWSPRWKMMLAGCRKGHAVDRRAQIFCSYLPTKHAVPHLSPMVLTAVSTLQVYYQLWQKSRRHHLNSPCLKFLPGYPFIFGGITKQKGKRRRALRKRGWGWDAGSWRGWSLTRWCCWSWHLPFCGNCPRSLRTRGGKVSLWCPLLLPQLSCQGLYQISAIFTISPRHSMSMSLSFKQRPEKEIARTTQLNPLVSI